ncbi:MAG TPA: trehalase family glycosidase, partial [Candidatus Acidoferrum sp.]|nr:trehalase family glycosidase [Candidatus Acidoferrum sp.]
MIDTNTGIAQTRQFIAKSWDSLTRTLTRWESYRDPKTDEEAILYLPAELPEPPAIGDLQKRYGLDVRRLPQLITLPDEVDLARIQNEGLLYLEHPYVVPGGQFNEMYGWDSYFIILGLLRDQRIALAKGMVENFFFELDHYGSILNANRTYYLTRSQPPFLTSMVLALFHADLSSGGPDRAWLERGYAYAVRDYQQWVNPPHLAGDTPLSRYFDHGDGPVPEIMGNPNDYYRGVAHFFLLHDGADANDLIRLDGHAPDFPITGPIFPFFGHERTSPDGHAKHSEEVHRLALAADFYKGDRSMRESGFDVSFRFGSFSAQTHHFAPVCLNSLLYKTETDLAAMSELLGKAERADEWKAMATTRRQLIDKYLWNAEQGLYFDYNAVANTLSTYEYATTFYPLWVGEASQEQAARVVQNLARFEQPGGLAMSTRESEAQWDFPYGWAPIQLLAVQGLHRYGYAAEAHRIAENFLSMVAQN